MKPSYSCCLEGTRDESRNGRELDDTEEVADLRPDDEVEKWWLRWADRTLDGDGVLGADDGLACLDLNAVNGVTGEGVVTDTAAEWCGCDLCGGFDLERFGTRPPKSLKPLPKNSVGMKEVCECEFHTNMYVCSLRIFKQIKGCIECEISYRGD